MVVCRLLRGNLVPTCRLPTTRQARLTLNDPLLDKDELEILDAEQEKLACSLGDGHRLFFGVAGAVWVASLAQINQRGHDANMSLPALFRNVWRANLPCMANDLMVASLVRPQSGR